MIRLSDYLWDFYLLPSFEQTHMFLVGGFNPFEKNMCQNWFIFPNFFEVKHSKNIWVATTQGFQQTNDSQKGLFEPRDQGRSSPASVIDAADFLDLKMEQMTRVFHHTCPEKKTHRRYYGNMHVMYSKNVYRNVNKWRNKYVCIYVHVINLIEFRKCKFTEPLGFHWPYKSKDH